MSITTELAKRIVTLRHEDLPADAYHWAKVSLIDLIACALAAAEDEAFLIAQRVLTADKGSGPSLIWGTNRRAAPLDAAAINGTAAHALDYDDCSASLGGHPTAPIMPAVIALAESLGASGRDALLAYVAGFETQARLGRAVHMHHYEKGWHPTATLGVFGSTAACAKLMNLTEEKTAIALAIAVSLSSGVKANFGTMTKPLHAGHCTRNGLYAALLAREGFTANPDAFEHKQGFFNVYNGPGNFDVSKVLESWGQPLDVLSPGVGLKQYPCCGSTHSAIDAAIKLQQEHSLTPDRIAKIVSVNHERALVHVDRVDPRSTLDAKFSLQYCIARALMHGDVTFEHFEGNSYQDPVARKLLDIVELQTHAHKAKNMLDHFECEVIVTTTDGKIHSARVDHPLRGPQNLNPPDRLESKFHDCAARALSGDAIPKIYSAMQSFETVTDVRQLTNMLEKAAKSMRGERIAA